MDLHPVAVTLARVTYLLAIGTERLAQDRGELRVPVFLGDSLQWEERGDLLTSDDDVTIATAGSDLAQGQETLGFHEMPLFGDNLVFPRSIVADAERFDALVTALADGALDQSKREDATILKPIFKAWSVADGHEKDTLTGTFRTMRDLQRRGRDHIWGYYVRNLIRPLWLSQPSNRVDLLIGNPPWLRYNKMTPAMQTRYKVMAQAKDLLSGPKGASSRDMARWWEQVESVWAENRRKPLRERMDYARQLSSQLPLTQTLRVVYSKSGNTLTAATLTNPAPLIDTKLYWAPARSLDEARYLTGILNSAVLLERVRPLQAVGLFGPRDFDKHVFKVPFGAYDASNPDHRALVAVVEEAEACAAAADIAATSKFQTARKLIRQALAEAGIADHLEAAAHAVLPTVDL